MDLLLYLTSLIGKAYENNCLYPHSLPHGNDHDDHYISPYFQKKKED